MTGPLIAFETIHLVGIPHGIRVSPLVFWFLPYTCDSKSTPYACSTSSPLPFSWLAVRYVHRFCLMLPPDAPFLEAALALLALPFRPVTAGVSPVSAGLLPTLWSEARRLRHARRTFMWTCLSSRLSWHDDLQDMSLSILSEGRDQFIGNKHGFSLKHFSSRFKITSLALAVKINH